MCVCVCVYALRARVRGVRAASMSVKFFSPLHSRNLWPSSTAPGVLRLYSGLQIPFDSWLLILYYSGLVALSSKVIVPNSKVAKY